MHTHTEQSLAHLAAHVADMLQQGLQGLQGTVTVVVAPRAGCTLAKSCSNTSARTGRGGLRSHLVQELLRVEAERLTWWSVRRSTAQRLTALCIELRSVVLVKWMSERYSTLLTGEPGCREWAACESALAAQDPPSVIAPYSHTHSRCMYVCMYLWRGDWHHWWLWGGGSFTVHVWLQGL